MSSAPDRHDLIVRRCIVSRSRSIYSMITTCMYVYGRYEILQQVREQLRQLRRRHHALSCARSPRPPRLLLHAACQVEDRADFILRRCTTANDSVKRPFTRRQSSRSKAEAAAVRTESRGDPRDASEQHVELLQREPLLPAARQQQVLARHALAGHLKPALPAARLAPCGGVAAALGLPLPRQLQPQ